MGKEKWYIEESALDDYQYVIYLKGIDKSFIVKGCAGSGKTNLALWQTNKIASSNNGSYYFIVFTKALRKFIDDGLQLDEIVIDQSRVLHYHQWKKRSYPKADYIIVDEVQDFGKDEIQRFVNAANKALIFFGDSSQQLYKWLKPTVMTMEEISVFTNLKLSELTFNHRLPKKIARVAQHFNNDDESLVDRCKKRGGNKPYKLIASSWENQMDRITTIIEENEYTDVGILFISGQKVKEAYQYYNRNNFRVEGKYDIQYPDDILFNLNFQSENPKILTFASAKGLQFEAVFIPDCSTKISGDRVKSFYVAMTRTYQDLYFLSYNGFTGLINEVPEQLFEKIDNDYSPSFDDNFDDDIPF
jgi:superfamily I DNA/RNA helicase